MLHSHLAAGMVSEINLDLALVCASFHGARRCCPAGARHAVRARLAVPVAGWVPGQLQLAKTGLWLHRCYDSCANGCSAFLLAVKLSVPLRSRLFFSTPFEHTNGRCLL